MKKLLFSLCVLGVLAACSDDDDQAGGFVPQPSERTVIVYMSGENSLTAYVNSNLREMKEGSHQLGPSSCLLVYVDKSKNSELPWLARIRNGQVTDSVSLADMGISQKDEYASDPQVMEDVLKYAVSRYPATSDYGLVLWGHSTGWLIGDSIPYTRAYGIDNGVNSSVSDEGKWINIPTLAKVLGKVPAHWKFILADCCNFMCLESLYELRGVADYIIGSPAEIPQEGAPYDKVVPAMFDRDNFAMLIVDHYYSFKCNGLDLPLTVVKCGEMEQLAQATRTAMQAVKSVQTTEYADMKDLIFYYYGDQRYFYNPENSIFYDAGDFLRTNAPENAYQAWKQAYDKAVVKKTFSAKWFTNKKWDTFYGDNFTATPDRQHGVSMYVPQSPFAGKHAIYNREIKKLAWYYAVLQ